MAVYKIESTYDSKVESLLIQNEIQYKQFETSTHAFVTDILEDAAVVYPEFESLSSEEINELADALIGQDWVSHAGKFMDGFLGKSISASKAE